MYTRSEPPRTEFTSGVLPRCEAASSPAISAGTIRSADNVASSTSSPYLVKMPMSLATQAGVTSAVVVFSPKRSATGAGVALACPAAGAPAGAAPLAALGATTVGPLVGAAAAGAPATGAAAPAPGAAAGWHASTGHRHSASASRRTRGIALTSSAPRPQPASPPVYRESDPIRDSGSPNWARPHPGPLPGGEGEGPALSQGERERGHSAAGLGISRAGGGRRPPSWHERGRAGRQAAARAAGSPNGAWRR